MARTKTDIRARITIAAISVYVSMEFLHSSALLSVLPTLSPTPSNFVKVVEKFDHKPDRMCRLD
jgi:hypothetical protein